MRYFKSQEQAVALFKALNTAANNGRVTFIVVQHPKFVKSIISDLAILLQNKELVIKADGIRIKGNKDELSKTIKVVPNVDYILAGIPATQIIRMEDIDNGGSKSTN